MTVNDNANDVAVTESYKPIWNWKISQYNVSDIKFETMIKPQFADRIYFSNCLPLIPSTRPTYFGDTMAQSVQFCSFSQDIWESWLKEENFLSQLLNIEDEVLNVLLRENFVTTTLMLIQ